MIKPINDGGPAFPVLELRHTCGDPIIEASAGMSLRDWFAGQALASMTVASDYSKGPCDAAMAQRAYAVADAMLNERDRKGGAE